MTQDLDNIRPFLEASPNAYLILRPDRPHFTILEANRALCEITHRKREDIVGKSIFDGFKAMSGEQNEKGVRVLRDCLERTVILKKKHRCSLQRYDLQDGEGFGVRFWNYEVAPILDDAGDVSYLLEHVVDVTDSVLAEAEEKARDPLIDSCPDAIGSLDIKGNFLSANRAMLELTECTREELFRHSFVPFIPMESFTHVFSSFQKIIGGEAQNFETHFVSTKGSRFVISVSCMPIKIQQEIIGVHFVARNVTNLRNAEKQLEQYHLRLASIVESIRDGFFAMDRNGVIEYWNREAERVLGVDSDDVVGKNIWHVLSSNLFPRFYASQQRALNERIPIRYEEYSQALKSWLEVAIFPSPNGLSVYFKDISERVAVEQALEASEQRFKAMVQNGSDVISILDRKGNYLYMSPSSKATLGRGPDFWIGRNVLEFVHPDDLDRVSSMLLNTTKEKLVYLAPFRFKRNGFEYRWIESIVTDMTNDPAVGGLVANTQDVTERVEYVKAIEEQNKRLRDIAFIQSHLVRAPLMRIKGLADVITNYETDPTQVKALLGLLDQAADELDDVVRDIVEKTDNL
ncbi:MAG: PAS domain-containing protein [Arcticibacter sp.]